MVNDGVDAFVGEADVELAAEEVVNEASGVGDGARDEIAIG